MAQRVAGEPSSNWAALKAALGTKAAPPGKGPKKRRRELNEAAASTTGGAAPEDAVVDGTTAKRAKVDRMTQGQSSRLSDEAKARYVGLDCEMVGTGSDGKTSVLARCCMVNFDGEVIYDSFVKPEAFVTDFRTEWSGVRSKDLFGKAAKNTVTFAECQRAVAAALKNKVLVGHALKNDLDVLSLSHPRHFTRDTARYRPYMRKHANDKFRPRALRELAKDFLGVTIQTGEHDPAEDARSALMLYRLRMHEWEKELRERKFGGPGGGKAKKTKSSRAEGAEKSVATQSVPAPASTSMFGGEARGLRSVSDVDKDKRSKQRRQ